MNTADAMVWNNNKKTINKGILNLPLKEGVASGIE